METIVNLKDEEIISLMKNGFPFKLSRKVKLINYWKFWEPISLKDIVETFKIKELPLVVMEKIAQQSNRLSEHFSLNHLGTKYSTPNDYKILCKIIAMAIMGDELGYLQEDIFGNLKFHIRKNELKNLTKILSKSLKPSDVKRLIELVEITHNHGDFINAIMKIKGGKAFKNESNNTIILN